MVGRVKWFNNRKGYGFIHFEEDKDVLVHYSSIIDKGYRSLIEGFILLVIHNSFGNPVSIEESFQISIDMFTNGLDAIGANGGVKNIE